MKHFGHAIIMFHFFSWRIFESKKIAFAKILVRRLRHSSFETKSELFHPFEVLMLHEFFSLKRCWWIDWVKDWSCLKEREKWVECKATLDNMIGCFEKEWWKGNDGERMGGLRLRLDFLYRLEQLLGNVVWLTFSFEKLKIANFAFNLLVAWGWASSPQSASVKWVVVSLKSVSPASVFV